MGGNGIILMVLVMVEGFIDMYVCMYSVNVNT